MGQNQNIGVSRGYSGFHVNRRIEQLVKGVLYSSMFISCCAFSLTIETYKLAGLQASLPMASFVFLATLFTYNLSSVYSVIRRPWQKINDAEAHWTQRHKKMLAGLGMCSIALGAGIYFYFGLRVNFWIVLHLALISIGYTVPFVFRSRRVKPLRSVPLLKVFLIAYVWAVVTALFPLMDAGVAVWQGAPLLLLLRRFLFILALALLFDIRDYTYDRTMKTLTIPGLIGVRNTKLISLGLLLVYVLVSMKTETGAVQGALLASAVGAGLVVILSSENRPRIYYLLLADGAMLLHAGLVYLAFS
ncbi:hypothetical protein ACSX1A_15810 [Pontibacter sp. MBLB2868]|uniref:hypothetical protein n=1 Tax=Pontibacter sp. MBLB2868 TaxID=3451555 RepID=UPI003F75633C